MAGLDAAPDGSPPTGTPRAGDAQPPAIVEYRFARTAQHAPDGAVGEPAGYHGRQAAEIEMDAAIHCQWPVASCQLPGRGRKRAPAQAGLPADRQNRKSKILAPTRSGPLRFSCRIREGLCIRGIDYGAATLEQGGQIDDGHAFAHRAVAVFGDDDALAVPAECRLRQGNRTHRLPGLWFERVVRFSHETTSTCAETTCPNAEAREYRGVPVPTRKRSRSSRFQTKTLRRIVDIFVRFGLDPSWPHISNSSVLPG